MLGCSFLLGLCSIHIYIRPSSSNCQNYLAQTYSHAGALNCEVPAANKGRYSVVVIGAGVSGLSAAHQLMRRGICDVLVVEALDRMGGRVKQVYTHDPD